MKIINRKLNRFVEKAKLKKVLWKKEMNQNSILHQPSAFKTAELILFFLIKQV